jgi:uncharacterized cupin superfamily protein
MFEPAIIKSTVGDDLASSPIDPAWVISGSPQARTRLLAGTGDKAAHVLEWDCTPGVFNWYYAEEDEIGYILEGEAFISRHGGAESRLGPGDVVVFSAGTSCRWRVTKSVRKIAVLHKRLPRFLSLGVRAWHRFLRTLPQPAQRG